jgi:hypothetical protein
MAVSVAMETPARASAVRWIESPGWDLFWMFSALWGAALLLAGSSFAQVAIVGGTLFVFNRIIATCHSWSTTYMVLFSPLLDGERRAHRTRYVAIPALIAAGALGLGVYVGATQRFPADGRLHAGLWAWMLYIGLFWVGHFWHFGNQDFGVLTLYRARAGQSGMLDRKADKAFAVAMMFVIQPIVYVSAVVSSPFSEMVHTYAPLRGEVLAELATWAVAAAVVLTVAAIGYELSKPNRSVPKLLYLLVMLFHPLFLHYAVLQENFRLAFLYVIAYLWSHWFIAIGLVSRINSRYYEARGDSPRRALLRHGAVLGGITGFVWLLTYHHSKYGLFNMDSFRYKHVLAGLTPEQGLVVGCFLGFYLAEQLLHYYCDRRLFRMRDPGIRRSVAPLLLSQRR